MNGTLQGEQYVARSEVNWFNFRKYFHQQLCID